MKQNSQFEISKPQGCKDIGFRKSEVVTKTQLLLYFQMYLMFQEEFKLEFCFQGKDAGEGDSKQPRWYYDHEDGVCKVNTKQPRWYYDHEDGVCKVQMNLNLTSTLI